MKTALFALIVLVSMSFAASAETIVNTRVHLQACNPLVGNDCSTSPYNGEGYGLVVFKTTRLPILPGGKSPEEKAAMQGRLEAFLAVYQIVHGNEKVFETSPLLVSGSFGRSPTSDKYVFYVTKMTFLPIDTGVLR